MFEHSTTEMGIAGERTVYFPSESGLLVQTEIELPGECDEIKSLSASHKDVYYQYVKDADDNLLVDGYYRRHMSSTTALPPDINHIIASYYVKSFSKRVIAK